MTVSDGVHTSAAQSLTITLNDANEFAVTTPVDSDGTTNAVNENASNGTLVGITASASDADATTNGVTYSLTNSAEASSRSTQPLAWSRWREPSTARRTVRA